MLTSATPLHESPVEREEREERTRSHSDARERAKKRLFSAVLEGTDADQDDLDLLRMTVEEIQEYRDIFGKRQACAEKLQQAAKIDKQIADLKRRQEAVTPQTKVADLIADGLTIETLADLLQHYNNRNNPLFATTAKLEINGLQSDANTLRESIPYLQRTADPRLQQQISTARNEVARLRDLIASRKDLLDGRRVRDLERHLAAVEGTASGWRQFAQRNEDQADVRRRLRTELAAARSKEHVEAVKRECQADQQRIAELTAEYEDLEEKRLIPENMAFAVPPSDETRFDEMPRLYG